MGHDKALDLLKRLGDNKPVFVESHTQALTQVQAGEPIAAATIYGYKASSLKEKTPDSVEFINSNPLPASLTLVDVVKDAPHPAAARLFEDWIVSKEGQTAVVDITNHTSIRPDVKNDPTVWDETKWPPAWGEPEPAQRTEYNHELAEMKSALHGAVSRGGPAPQPSVTRRRPPATACRPRTTIGHTDGPAGGRDRPPPHRRRRRRGAGALARACSTPGTSRSRSPRSRSPTSRWCRSARCSTRACGRTSSGSRRAPGRCTTTSTPFTSDGFGTLVLNSFVYAGATAIVSHGGRLRAGLAGRRTNTPAKGFARVAALVPLIVPGILNTVAWSLLLSPQRGTVNVALRHHRTARRSTCSRCPAWSSSSRCTSCRWPT